MYVCMYLWAFLVDFTVVLARNERWVYDMHHRRLGDLR